jgi:hypothetical protein
MSFNKHPWPYIYTVYMHYIPRVIICLQKDIASVTWGKTLPLRQRLSQEDKGRHAVGKVSSSASQASLLHLKMARRLLISVLLVVATLVLTVHPQHPYVLHEKRDALHPSWVKRDRVGKDVSLLVRIALKDDNVDRASELLMEVYARSLL